jgi:2-polyprenyl-3-methyl-5-hydroxy-6-metoxy-1,4-benzoquinol methylase
MLAMIGCDVTGIDLVEDAISDAKAKAIERHVKVNFIVGDVLQLDRFFMDGEFDIVIDSGLFHVMTDEERQFLYNRFIECLRQGANISCYASPIRGPKDTGQEGSQKLK